MRAPDHHLFEAYETYGWAGHSPLLLTCEHASRRIPAPLRSSAADRGWLGTHWGWDIGARTVTRELTRAARARSICARFSRLVCDANRPPGGTDYIRPTIEDQAISFNGDLPAEEIARRSARYHHPYHQAIDHEIKGLRPKWPRPFLFSIHSFTPVFNGMLRSVQVGVLFDKHEELAIMLRKSLADLGFSTGLNEPYTAFGGLAYSVQRHGKRHDLPYLELELNQALIREPARARRVGRALNSALQPILSLLSAP
jgi:predicted N-formylglutamate amidohydrolase